MVFNCKQMVLTPQVVEDWIKEDVWADKDKSTSKKDIWSEFHKGLPFISIEERANFFSLFGFAIRKFANISVIKLNSKNVGYQGIYLENVTALNKQAVMDWATTKLQTTYLQRKKYGIVLRFIIESWMNSIANNFLDCLEWPLLAMVCFRPCQ